MSSGERANGLVELLETVFTENRALAVVDHYLEMTDEFRRSHWESTTVKGGKFTEAVLKCLLEHIGANVPEDKAFKVDKAIQQLEQTPSGSFKDSVRLTIPRAIRFIYDVASNRGARHDSGELDPNQMDANAVAATCSWILAELIRYSQKGKLSPPAALRIVVKLSAKKYPLFEEINGRIYLEHTGLGARRMALLLLAYCYPERMGREDLVATLLRHGEKKANAQTAIARLKTVIDDDGHGRIMLRSSGLQEAERLLAELGASQVS